LVYLLPAPLTEEDSFGRDGGTFDAEINPDDFAGGVLSE
jgi:hypothetical protein